MPMRPTIRNRSRVTLAGLVLALSAAVGSALWWHRQAPALPSELAFNFTDGTRSTAADFRNRPLLLSFWSVSCPACLADLASLADFQTEIRSEGANLLLINVRHDPPAAIFETLRARDLRSPSVLDVRGEIDRAVGGIEGVPVTLLVDAQGRIVQRLYGKLDKKRARALLKML